jgi:hypothetical protein
MDPAQAAVFAAEHEEFEAAAKFVASGKLPPQPNDVKLQFYALFKQAEFGKCAARRALAAPDPIARRR